MNFKTSKLLGTAALASLLIALPALGQDAEVAEEVVESLSEGVSADVVFILNSFLMIFGGVLVMWMAAGFAMLEAGLVRTKNVSMQLLKNIFDRCDLLLSHRLQPDVSARQLDHRLR